MTEPFEASSEMKNDMVISRKMKTSDISALSEKSNNDNVFHHPLDGGQF